MLLNEWAVSGKDRVRVEVQDLLSGRDMAGERELDRMSPMNRTSSACATTLGDVHDESAEGVRRTDLDRFDRPVV
ncbi:hypothetical protein [Streptomyces arenae]|uniref:hypothetical protein n=1 Tax=Streptomyces arenae TaxID=29301 RepID=UPI00265AD944|nr:hypothetical protein [Streptomyces arenae]MCG7202310.1 hypothetical protein [Streptomyces arenae]